MIKSIGKAITFAVQNAYKLQKSYVVIRALIAILESALPFVSILGIRMIISEVLERGRFPYAAGILCGMLGLIFLIRFLLIRLTWSASTGFIKLKDHFTVGSARKMMRMDYGCLEDPQKRDVMSNLWQTDLIASGVVEELSNLVSGVIGLLGSVAVISTLNPWVCLVLFGLVLITSTSTRRTALAVNYVDEEAAPDVRKGDYLKKTARSNANGKEIRLFSMEGFFGRHINGNMEKLLSHHTKKEKLLFTNSMITSLANGVQLAVLYGFMIMSYVRSAISISDFSMYIGVAGNFFACISKITGAFSNIAAKHPLLDRYYAFHSMPEALRKIRLPEACVGSQRMEICFDDVSFAYPHADHNVLSHVTVTINPGEVISIVGENGAGKTTFVKLLTRLYEPTEGCIRMNGVDIRHIPYDEYLRMITPVFQDYHLFAYSIRENITIESGMGNAANDEAVWCALGKAGLREKVAGLEEGLGSHLLKGHGWKAVELSVGEMQKMAIARSFYKEAAMAILDEPTAAVDPLAEQALYTRFKEWIGGKTAIFVSHRMSSSKFSDRVLFMENGTVTEMGTHEALMERGGAYAHMYEIQAQYYRS